MDKLSAELLGLQKQEGCWQYLQGALQHAGKTQDSPVPLLWLMLQEALKPYWWRMWLKLCAALPLPPFLCLAAERKLNELLKPSSLSQPSPRLSGFCGKLIAPWGHFHCTLALPGIQTCWQQSLLYQAPNQSSAGGFSREGNWTWFIKKKKGIEKNQATNTHHFDLQENSMKHTNPRGQDDRHSISWRYEGTHTKLTMIFSWCLEGP